MTTPTAPTAKQPCPCGDYDCADRMPTNQDRAQCCQYCGYYDCDVCGWTDPSGATLFNPSPPRESR